MIKCSEILVLDNEQILIWKKKKWFWEWKYVFVWWKNKKNETYIDCAKRELLEETWIDIDKNKLEKIWCFYYYYEWWETIKSIAFLYKYNQEELIETDEILPCLFDFKSIPYNKMWWDCIVWLPKVLKWEKNLKYKFFFDKNKELINYK